MADLEFMTPSERLDYLQSNCDDKERKGYYRPFTDAEIEEKKVILMDKSIKLMDEETEFDSEKANFKNRIAPLEKAIKEVTKQLKERAEWNEGMCYKFIRHDLNIVEFYDINGQMVFSRDINESEKQFKIFPVNQL
jgi:hypothetical protein